MNRKAKLLIGAIALVLLGLGATFAVAQYRMGIGGHYGAMGGMGFHLGMFCGDGSRADRILDRLEGRLLAKTTEPRQQRKPMTSLRTPGVPKPRKDASRKSG